MKQKIRRFKGALVAGSVILLAFPAFAPSARAADPVPPFTECPASGHAPSCNVLIVFNADGSVGIFQGQPTRIDDDDDTLVGVRNSSGATIPNVILSSSDPNIQPFAFDGDGMCTTRSRSAPRPTGCPFQTTGTGADYAGPGITYTLINTAKTSGTVNFAESCTQTTTCTSTAGLTAGSTVFFSLEDKVDAGNIVVPPNITSSKSASPNPAFEGDVVTYTIKLSNSGSVAGTTDVIDDYDETHITNISNITGGGVNNSPSAGMIKWTAVSVPPGTDTVTLSYQGKVTGPFSGNSAGTCGPDKFPVMNTVTLSNGTGTSNTLCVMKRPVVMTGRAYAASLSILDTAILGPTPDTGQVATEAASITKPPCFLPLPLPSDPGFIVDLEVLCAKVVTKTIPVKTSTATASVVHTTIVVPGLPAIDIGVIESSSTTTCGGSEGHTTIASLQLDGSEVLPQDIVPPNTDIPLVIGDLFLNEQIPFTSPDKGLTVNAVHLAVPGIIDLVLASSESDIKGCP